MAREGWDGYDFKIGIAGINKFREDVEEIVDTYLNYFNAYNVQLSELWASPNAVKYNDDLEQMLEFPKSLVSKANSLIDNTVVLHMVWAKIQGEEYEDTAKRIDVVDYDYIRLTESISSTEYGTLVGINPEEAKKCCEEFVSACKLYVVPKIEALRFDSGLADKDGELEASFKEQMAENAKNISDSLDVLQKNFDKKIKNEIKELRLSVQGAEATLEEGPGQVTNHAVGTPTDTPKPEKTDSTPKPKNSSSDRVSFF